MVKTSLYYLLPICAGGSLFYQAELALFDKIIHFVHEKVPFKRTAKPSRTVVSNPIGGARLFCQALFDSFWGSKKNEERIKTI